MKVITQRSIIPTVMARRLTTVMARPVPSVMARPGPSVMARLVRATPTRTQARQIPRTSPTPPVTARANQAPTP
jgi:hypothetical protein